jgi:AraC family transcriptional regulator
MPHSIAKQDLQAQRVIVAPRRIKRSEIAATITSALGDIFQYAQQHGLALSGHPFTRYRDFGAGLITIEPGMRIVASATGASAPPPANGVGSVFEDTLPAGPAMTTVHMGPYDALNEAYAALESWMESHGVQAAGAPWESYITDPAEFPDPKDWKTEIAWPVR